MSKEKRKSILGTWSITIEPISKLNIGTLIQQYEKEYNYLGYYITTKDT